MWKIVRIGERALSRMNALKNFNRTFLSESYACTEAWNKRFDSPILSQVNPINLFYEIDQQFQNSGKASAVDIDIFANVVKSPNHVDELVDTIHRFRLTMEATNILDSTHHAVIRYLLDNNEISDLIMILNDRINYGIFPDHLCFNMLMDTFIKKQDFASAAKVAVLLMLQEDSDNPICNALALYSCHKYLEEPHTWEPPPPPPPEDPKAEVTKIRVGYLRNPFFDDHFDLQHPNDLVGKTLVFYGKSMDDILGRSCHLRGLVLWKKYKKAVDLIEEWAKRKDQTELIYSEALAKIQEHLSNIPEDAVSDDTKELKSLVEGFDKKSLKDGSIIEDIEARIHKAVEIQQDIDISEACKAYEEWEKTRVSMLETQLAEINKKESLAKLEIMKKELSERERLLTFFENEETIELKISQKLERELKLYGEPKQLTEEIEENYIPPEIRKQNPHNQR